MKEVKGTLIIGVLKIQATVWNDGQLKAKFRLGREDAEVINHMASVPPESVKFKPDVKEDLIPDGALVVQTVFNEFRPNEDVMETTLTLVPA